MKISAIVSLFLVASGVTSHPTKPTTCKHLRIRKEWRTLTQHEKTAYFDAVLCLHSKPSILSDLVPSSLTHFEDFVAVHKLQTPYIHLCGHFLPWHRYLLWHYETTLREVCGYKGAQPYWDYTLDRANASLSPVILDFGGNGPKLPVGPPVPGYPNGTGGGCVQEGPFREGKFELHVAPKQETERKDRCLSRDINNQIAWDHATHEKVAKILEQPDFGWMTKTAEGLGDYPNLGIHNMAHYIISGTSGDTFDSNAEPLFYLHHGKLDRIWWTWQQANKEKRTFDVSGKIIPWANFGGDFSHLSKGNVTLDFEMNLGRLHGPIKVKEIMHTTGDYLCYEYE